MKIRLLLLITSLGLFAPSTGFAYTTYLYKVKLVQAAPGKLLEVIDLYKASLGGYKDAGDDSPLWMRHSQCDHWDLLTMIPMKRNADYSNPERVAQMRQAQL